MIEYLRERDYFFWVYSLNHLNNQERVCFAPTGASHPHGAPPLQGQGSITVFHGTDVAYKRYRPLMLSGLNTLPWMRSERNRSSKVRHRCGDRNIRNPGSLGTVFLP